MSSTTLRPSRAPLGGSRSRPAVAAHRWLVRLLALLLTWQERIHQRRQLQALSDHMLRDLGLSRADAASESIKPFWRP